MTNENEKSRPSVQKKRNRPSSRGRRRKGASQFGKGAYVENSAALHQGRILAMQTLFEMDSADRDLDEIIGRYRLIDLGLPESVTQTADADEIAVDEIPGDVANHAEKLARGAAGSLAEIDPVIEKAAPAFPIAQIAAVDRNVLRLAIYELLHVPDVPVGVAINEAVEIAKRFGGPNSGKFVNGVLGTISRQLPAERSGGESGSTH